MQNKTVIVILVVAASLLAYIFLFDRDAMTTSERLGRKGRVFVEFKQDAVQKLALTSLGGSAISLSREPDPANAGEGTWRITAPKKLDGDGSAVREVLSAIDFVLMDRAVKGAEQVKDARFGLQTPRVAGSFVIRGKTTTFKVGADAEGDKVYLYTDAVPDTVFAVEKSFLASVDKGLDDLRSKKLVGEALADAGSVQVERAIGKIGLKREDKGDWQVRVGDTWILASGDQVRELLSKAADLEAESFVMDGAKEADLERYGLAKPAGALTVTTEKGSQTEILIGAPCADKNQRHATVKGSGVVACVNDDFSALLERPLLRFQETRPVVAAPEDVTKVSLTAKGKSLVLERGDDGWSIPGAETPIESSEVEALLKSLTETRATEVAVGEAAVTALPSPDITVTLTLADDMGEKTLTGYKGTEENGKMKRGEEPAVLTLPGTLFEKLTTDGLAFRAKRMEQGDTADVTRLAISGPVTQSLEKREGTWHLTAPLEEAADNTQAREVADILATVEADRFAAEKADKRHGLAPPYATIRATFSPEKDEHDHSDNGEEEKAAPKSSREVVLELGAETDDGKRFARLKGKDPVVFVVGDKYDAATKRPLIARDLLQIDDTEVRKIAFSAGENTLTVAKAGEGWAPEGESTVKKEQLDRLVQDLAGMKTVSAKSFGPAGDSLGATTLEIRAWTEEQQKADTPTILTIGQKSPDENEDGYLAAKSGLKATFTVPARIIDDILKLLTPEK